MLYILMLFRIDSCLLIVRKISRPKNKQYREADKSLARPTSQCILFDDENISMMLVLLYI